jgi:hypothetical protein
MDTRAGKRKAEQAPDVPAAELAADGGAAKSGSKTFDLAAYRVAVENAKRYAADAVETLEKFRSELEDEVILAMGKDSMEVFLKPEVRTSYANAKLMATRAAEATAYLASPASPQLTAPFEVFQQSIWKAEDDAKLALGQLNVERQLRAEELDRHRELWELRLAEELQRERNANSTVVKQLEEARSELALSKKRVEDLDGRNAVCMDAAALLELRKVLELALWRVEQEEGRRACLPFVPEMLPSAACPLTKQCMIFPVVAADGHTYERSAIEKHMQAGGEEATSPLTGEKLASHDLETDWSMRKAIVEAVEKVFERRKAGGK